MSPSGCAVTGAVTISSKDQLETRDDQILVEAINGIGNRAASAALELGVLDIEQDLDVPVEDPVQADPQGSCFSGRLGDVRRGVRSSGGSAIVGLEGLIADLE